MLLARLLGYEEKLRGVVVVMTVFTNIGFMGVPMVRGIYGADALIYMTVFLIPFNILFFSYAVSTIRGKTADAAPATPAEPKPSLLKRLRGFFNNGMIACFLAIILYFADLPVPAPLKGGIEMLGLMTAPLAMLLMGSFLVDVDWLAALCLASPVSAEAPANAPIVLETQGSFTVGGGTLTHEGTFSREHFLEPQGQVAYGDHAYVFYQVPVKANAYPIVFQHGGAQTKRTWESTPDGRDGFQNIFLRKGYAVYLLDQPRMGEAGLALKAAGPENPYAKNPLYADKSLYELCRIGVWPDRFDGVAFPEGEAAAEAFQRAWTPYAGELDDDVNAAALGKLFERIGPAILFTHSMGGTIGWRTPALTENVKAIVAFEPGGSPFVFPEGEVPVASKAVYAPVSATAIGVPLERFEKLTKLPILVLYGDNIADKPSNEVGPDKWRSERDMAEKFVAAVNRHGGKAEIVRLPDVGIRGNTHFLMSDLNNREVAEFVQKWLEKQGLAGRKAE